MKRRLRLHNLLLLTLLFVGKPLFAPDRASEGVDLVAARLPALWTSATESLTQPGANDLFALWTRHEIDYFNAELTYLYADTNKGEVVHPQEIFDKYWTSIFGDFGETFAQIAFRNAARKFPGARWINDAEYERLNPVGKKPDGVMYRVLDGELLIVQVLESKMGYARYDRVQADGYLMRWQLHGITVLIDDKPTYFEPEKLRLFLTPTDAPPRSLVLGEASVDDLESVTLYFATDPPYEGARLHYVEAPFTAAEAEDIIYRFVRHLVTGKPIEPASVARVQKPAAMPEPVLVAFRQQLNDWILDHGRFPRSADAGLGRLLAKRISQRGSQMHVFMTDLTDETRLVMAVSGHIPALGPMQRYLLGTSPFGPDGKIKPEMAAAYRAYAICYGHDFRPLLQAQAVHSLDWKRFFATLPDPYDPSPVETEHHACVMAVSQARARRALNPDPLDPPVGSDPSQNEQKY